MVRYAVSCGIAHTRLSVHFVSRTPAAAGRIKSKATGDKLCLLAVECLAEVFKLCNTLQHVAGILQDVPTADQDPIAGDSIGQQHRFNRHVTLQLCSTCNV